MCRRVLSVVIVMEARFIVKAGQNCFVAEGNNGMRRKTAKLRVKAQVEVARLWQQGISTRRSRSCERMPRLVPERGGEVGRKAASRDRQGRL